MCSNFLEVTSYKQTQCQRSNDGIMASKYETRDDEDEAKGIVAFVKVRPPFTSTNSADGRIECRPQTVPYRLLKDRAESLPDHLPDRFHRYHTAWLCNHCLCPVLLVIHTAHRL